MTTQEAIEAAAKAPKLEVEHNDNYWSEAYPQHPAQRAQVETGTYSATKTHHMITFPSSKYRWAR